MTTAEQALLIILSVFLALFLLLAIMAMVEALIILRRVRNLVEKAERVVGSAEAIGEIFRKTAGPISILRIVRSAARIVQHNKSKEK